MNEVLIAILTILCGQERRECLRNVIPSDTGSCNDPLYYDPRKHTYSEGCTYSGSSYVGSESSCDSIRVRPDDQHIAKCMAEKSKPRKEQVAACEEEFSKCKQPAATFASTSASIFSINPSVSNNYTIIPAVPPYSDGGYYISTQQGSDAPVVPK